MSSTFQDLGIYYRSDIVYTIIDARILGSVRVIHPKEKAMNSATVSRRVDRLGQIKKQINDLEKKMLEIREELLEAGIQEAQGRIYQVEFKEVDTTRVDWKAIQKDYDLPIEKYALISSCTRMMVSPR